MSPFAQQLERQAKRRGCGLAGVEFALGDRGARIWLAVKELFRSAIQGLDACHVAAQLFEAAKRPSRLRQFAGFTALLEVKTVAAISDGAKWKPSACESLLLGETTH